MVYLATFKVGAVSLLGLFRFFLRLHQHLFKLPIENPREQLPNQLQTCYLSQNNEGAAEPTVTAIYSQSLSRLVALSRLL